MKLRYGRAVFRVEQRQKIIVLFLVALVFLWLLTIASTRFNHYPPDAFHYAKSLPVSYWLGMMLACILFVSLIRRPLSGGHKTTIEIVFIAILVLYLFGIVCFAYPTLRFFDSYGMAERADWIAENSGIFGAYTGVPTYRTEFPGSTVLFATVSETIGVETMTWAKYYPIYLMLSIAMVLYATGRGITRAYSLAAPVAFLAVSWPQVFHMSPQGHCLILVSVLIALVVGLATTKRIAPGRVGILLVIVWGAICVSHPTSALFSLVALVFLCVAYFVSRAVLSRRRMSTAFLIPIRSVIRLAPLFMVAFVVYLTWAADYVFASVAAIARECGHRLVHASEYFVTTNRLVTTPAQSYLDASYFRWVVIVCILVLGATVAAYLLVRNREKTLPFVVGCLFTGYIGIAVFLVVVGYEYYGHERSLVFATIAFAIMASMLLASRVGKRMRSWSSILTLILVTFVVFAMMSLPVTRYASDPYEFASEPEYAARMFAMEHGDVAFHILRPCLESSANNAYLKNLLSWDEYVSRIEADLADKIYESGTLNALYWPRTGSQH